MTGNDPQVAGGATGSPILGDGQDLIARQALRLPVVGECAVFRVQPVQTAPEHARPDDAASVYMHSDDAVITEAGRFGRVVPVTSDLSGRSVYAIQSSASRAYPDVTATVLCDG